MDKTEIINLIRQRRIKAMRKMEFIDVKIIKVQLTQVVKKRHFILLSENMGKKAYIKCHKTGIDIEFSVELFMAHNYKLKLYLSSLGILFTDTKVKKTLSRKPLSVPVEVLVSSPERILATVYKFQRMRLLDQFKKT